MPPCRSRPRPLVAALLLAAAAAQAPAAPSTQISLGGDVERGGVLTLADLQARPAVTQTVSFASGSGPQTHVYTGASLWDVLGQAGIRTDPAVKNDILGKYVLATGTDGYRTVYAAGELHPGFGNRPALLAYAETVDGASRPLADDGFARTTAPGDVRGGRYVSNVASLDVRDSGSTATGTGGGPSTRFSVTGAVAQTSVFDLSALRALPAVQQTMGGTTYTGVPLWSLLDGKVGLAPDPAVKNDVLGMYVVATGSDAYQALFSLGELDPGFGNQPTLVAYEADGAPLSDNGFARLVVPNDVRGGRAVSNLVSLEVFRAVSPVPEPTTLALMALGLAFVAWRLRQARPR